MDIQNLFSHPLLVNVEGFDLRLEGSFAHSFILKQNPNKTYHQDNCECL